MRKIILFTKKIDTNPMVNPSFHGPNQVSIDEFGENHFVHEKDMTIRILYVAKSNKKSPPFQDPKSQTFRFILIDIIFWFTKKL